MNTSEVKDKVDLLKQYQLDFLAPEKFEEFVEKTKDYKTVHIEGMLDETIIELNRSCSLGTFIDEPEFENEEALAEYLRSVLVFLIQSLEFSVEMDEKLKEYDELTKETNDILKDVYGDTNPIEVVSNAIEQSLEVAEKNCDMLSYANLLSTKETFEDTFKLERLKHLYKSIDPENLKEDAGSPRSLDIYKKYLRVNQQLGSIYDLCNVHDLEFRFLPKDYHEVNNLFIFACMKYISHLLDDGMYNSDDGFFASQLTTNLFMLHTNKLDEEHKETLLKNIQEFLDIIK